MKVTSYELFSIIPCISAQQHQQQEILDVISDNFCTLVPRTVMRGYMLKFWEQVLYQHQTIMDNTFETEYALCRRFFASYRYGEETTVFQGHYNGQNVKVDSMKCIGTTSVV